MILLPAIEELRSGFIPKALVFESLKLLSERRPTVQIHFSHVLSFAASTPCPWKSKHRPFLPERRDSQIILPMHGLEARATSSCA